MNTENISKDLAAALALVITELETIAAQNPKTHDWELTITTTGEADTNVVADSIEESLENKATLEALEMRFQNIERALRKLETGTFGTCEICSSTIEEERLLVNPSARTCIADRDRAAELPV